MLLPIADDRLAAFAPQPLARGLPEARLDRFPREIHALLAGQPGPLANLRSSAGCALLLATDSPWIELRLERLRHHQPGPVGVAVEVERAGAVRTTSSADLRGVDGACAVRLATGLERGAAPAAVRIWLPLISTCAVTGVAVADGARAERAAEPEPRWLAIGDSLTQGFICQDPTQCWVHLLSRRLGLGAWNLGVGGIRIEPEAFAWALAARRWELVTIGLGSNHAWIEGDVATVAARAARLAELALAGGHGRVVWLMPPWKPFEDGIGPRDFQGVPLDAAAAQRVGRIRAALAEALAPCAPRLALIDGIVPREARLLPDGLHPQAWGHARCADALAAALSPSDAAGA